MSVLARKIDSSIFKLSRFIGGLVGHFKIALNPNVKSGRSVYISPSSLVRGVGHGRVILGDHVTISKGAHIIAVNGSLFIGDHVYIGPHVHIVANRSISIGRDCQIAEFVVIRDQDHVMGHGLIRESGMNSGEIVIGENVWIGSKATVLRNVVIGNDAVVGAHSLVRSSVPERHLAAGVPARVVKKL